MNVAYALIRDGAFDDTFRNLDEQLVEDPAVLVGDDGARVPVIDGLRWDPATWGETPEAQANLMNALALSGPPADAGVG